MAHNHSSISAEPQLATRAERRRAARGGVVTAAGPSAPLLMQLRPMTIAEMVPGHAYEPGLSVLEVATLPVFGARGNEGRLWRLPVMLPTEYRENTTFNAFLAMEILRLTDPEAKEILESMAALARDPRSRAAAALHPLFDDQHPEKRRPNRGKAARPAKVI